MSRHAAFFASLQRVEDRLASESEQHITPPTPTTDTMTASPLLFLDPAPPPSTAGGSGPALDFLTEQDQQDTQTQQDGDDDMARLMALLGLLPPTDMDGGGCDCSGPDGFLGKVVGVVGPKCDREKRRLDAWIHHYHQARGRGRDGGGEPARLAHLLLAKASGETAPVAFPATVKGFLDRDAPPQ